MKDELLSWLVSFAVAVPAAIVISLFVFKIIRVKGASMLATLHDGDRLYVSVLTARIFGWHRGDVVICHYPGRRDLCVKRIVAIPGDRIAIDRGQVILNGAPLDEKYISSRAAYSRPEVALDRGEYFVLGDNRALSHDSHSPDVGPVSRIVGKARFIIWPIKRIGKIT